MSDALKNKVNNAKWWELWGFSFNNASTNAVFILVSTYFLVYTTEIYGFAAVLVGTLMTGTRLFDAVTDPIIGVFIDRTNTKFGRFRPWILGGAIITSVMTGIMFSGFRTGSQVGDLILVIVIYSIWVLGYTAQTACTKSAQTILTSVPKQRSMVNALGTLNTMIIAIFVMAGVLPIIRSRGGVASPGAWSFIGILIGAVQLAYAVFVVISLRHKDQPEHFLRLESSERPRFSDFIGIFKNNRALQMLIVAASTNKITMTMQGGLIILFFHYVAGDSGLQTSVTTMSMPLMLIAIFMMIRFIDRFGRKETFTFSSWGGMLWGFAAIPLVALAPSNMWWLVAVAAINWILIAGAMDINIISMIADSADYEYYHTGKFIPGMIGTAFSFIDKVISSFGTLIIGAVLTSIGFVSITETPSSPTIFWAVLVMYYGLPAIGHFFSIVAMRFYPLDKKTHEKMLLDLAEREKQPK